MHFLIFFSRLAVSPGKSESPTLKHRAHARKLIFYPVANTRRLDRFGTIVCLFPFVFKRGVVPHGRRSAQIPRLRIRNRNVTKNIENSYYGNVE